jgi:hypothetical protein
LTGRAHLLGTCDTDGASCLVELDAPRRYLEFTEIKDEAHVRFEMIDDVFMLMLDCQDLAE